jgi:hypothetical protein
MNGKPLFKAPGNANVPNLPQTFPSSGTGNGTNVPDPTRFPNVQSIPRNIPSGESATLIAQPPILRSFMMIKNASTSAGTLAVGFNSVPNGLADAAIELAPGGVAFFDQTVPQNKIYGRAIGGACDVMSTFSNGVGEVQ